MVNIFTKIDLITMLLITIIVISTLLIGVVVRNNRITQELSVEIEINKAIIDDLSDKLRKSDNLNKKLNNEIMELTESYLEMEENYLDLKLEFDKLQRNAREPMPTRSGEPRRVLLGTFEATAYDLSVASCGKSESHPAYGITANGTSLKGHTLESARAIAVDPKVIKLGSTVYVEFLDEEYKHLTGDFQAVDTGGAIKGSKIDVFFGSGDVSEEVKQFGRRKVKVWIVK